MAGLDPITAITNAVNTVLDRVLPDKAANDAAKASLLQAEVQGQIQAVLGQIQVDADEAANKSVWVSGWRPGVGWVCCSGLASQFLVRPFFTWIAALCRHPLEYPSLDMGTLLTLLLGILGIGIHEQMTNK